MNVKSRVERLERGRVGDSEAVRFRVIVPPKMTREEWQKKCREWQRDGARVFTVDFDREAEGGA